MTSLPNEVSARIARGHRPLTLHNSGYWFAGFLLIAFFAFWPTYFAKLPAKMDFYTHAHAVLMTIWLAMLIAQPFLIRKNLRGWHRAIGRASYLVVPLIAVTWVLLVHLRTRLMPAALFEKEGKFVYLPFVSAVLFLGAYAMAIRHRRTPPLHARYMICTAFAAVDAITSRLLFFNLPHFENPLLYQVVGFGLSDLLVAFFLLVDRGPHRKAFAQMLVLFVLLHGFWFTGGQTGAWLEVVRWFTSLPLT